MWEAVRDVMEHQWNAADDCEHEERGVGRTTPHVYTCPSAEEMTVLINTYHHDEGTSKGNYAACFGSSTYLTDPDPQISGLWVHAPKEAGAFGVVMLRGWKKVVQSELHPSIKGVWKMGLGQGTKIRDIADGTSHTLMISEVLGYNTMIDARGGWVLGAMGSSTFTAAYTPNSDIDDYIPMCDQTIPIDNPLHCYQNQINPLVWASARSRHPGVVNAALCDGSVRSFSDDIDIYVWQALSTIAGEEVFDMP